MPLAFRAVQSGSGVGAISGISRNSSSDFSSGTSPVPSSSAPLSSVASGFGASVALSALSSASGFSGSAGFSDAGAFCVSADSSFPGFG
jgi:hypothetical protein